MKRIMLVCKKNSRRSQMAEGFAKAFSQDKAGDKTGKDKVALTSAGLEASQVDPLVIQVMSEVGIDVSKQISRPLSHFNAEDFDWVISLCGCGVNLPQAWVLRELFEDWQLDDPEGHSIEVFRRVRDEVKDRVLALLSL
jgi:glutathione/glutaredoxin type arsenate reductase